MAYGNLREIQKEYQPMTGMLASVNSLSEAKLVLAENVDIIDLKEPALGSLGSLAPALVKQIVADINGKCPISATIGDLPMQPDLIFNAVKQMAGTGVNYVKIGFFASENKAQVIDILAELAHHINLIAVLFADTNPDLSLIDKLKTAGFHGVMLDTQNKKIGSLTGVMAQADIQRFVELVKSRDLICGLAGSLTINDIPILQAYQPDYLGFRGALCNQNERAGRINIQSVQAIKHAIVGNLC
jgi:(5-formylfuran-3-yl)methyl phosphate synthase